MVVSHYVCWRTVQPRLKGYGDVAVTLEPILRHGRWISIHQYSLKKEHTSCQRPTKLAVSINRLQAIMKQQPNTIAKLRNVTMRTSLAMLRAAPRAPWIVAIRHKSIRRLHARVRPSNFVRTAASFGTTQILIGNLRADINWNEWLQKGQPRSWPFSFLDAPLRSSEARSRC